MLFSTGRDSNVWQDKGLVSKCFSDRVPSQSNFLASSVLSATSRRIITPYTLLHSPIPFQYFWTAQHLPENRNLETLDALQKGLVTVDVVEIILRSTFGDVRLLYVNQRFGPDSIFERSKAFLRF